MMLSVAILLLVSVAALDASEDAECRCFPDQMSGETISNGKKFSDYFVDYTKNKVFLKYTMYPGLDILHDLAASKRYMFHADGTCKTYDYSNAGAYNHCVPDDAVKTESEDSITYSYTLDGKTIKKTMAKDTCVLKEFVRSSTRRGKVATSTISYNSVPTVSDAGVFDVATGDCTQS